MANIPTVFWLIQKPNDMPEDDNWLSPGERSVLARLRFPKRRAEWRLGRWTAKCLIRAFTKKSGARLPGEIEIRAAEDGAPEVFFDNQPAALNLSISHRAGVSFCAISPPHISLGCDLELIEPHSAAFINDYFTPAERSTVMEAPAAERPRLAVLIWSAKESALKSLREGLRRDTRSVEVIHFSEDEGNDWKPLTVRCQQSGRVFPGWWRSKGEYLQTLVCDSPVDKPVE